MRQILITFEEDQDAAFFEELEMCITDFAGDLYNMDEPAYSYPEFEAARRDEFNRLAEDIALEERELTWPQI